MFTHRRAALSLVAIAGLAMTANAQLFINEVFENPPDSTDPLWEYIEIYGTPGMSLDGYAIGQFKGGLDGNGDNIPDGSGGDNIPELDEAFLLDGLTIGDNGFLVIYNGVDLNSQVPGRLPAGANSANWDNLGNPVAGDTPGSLNNDGSSTYILVRLRANPVSFAKETLFDANFDGKVDFGTEAPPYYGTSGPEMVAPFQRVSELAWSNGGGKEYVSTSERELSDTPGFNPDAVSRINYFFDNPNLGSRSRDDGMGGFEIVSTRIADESFVYGELDISAVIGAASLEYDLSVDVNANISTKGPTDQTATPYDGTCDPEPFNPGPNPACLPNPAGSFLFDDVDLTGFALTPGDYNDGAALFQIRLESAQAPGDLPAGFTGQYWRTGDFDFDGDIDCDDITLIGLRAGATLDDITPGVDPAGVGFNDYRWQNVDFQVVLMMLNMDMTDGGGSNAAAITPADIAATRARLDNVCAGDATGDGFVGTSDLLVLLGNWGQPVDCGTFDGDFDNTGFVGTSDLLVLLGAWGTTCP